jgi:thiol:disulfide interchange protein DsbA
MDVLRRLAWAALLLLVCAGAAQAQLVKGRDYRTVEAPQPVAPGNKIEVVDVFWYGCPHCYHLEEPLTAWLKRKPADVEFRYLPGTFGAPAWEPLTRTYYALDAMGLVAKFHEVLFAAIHRDNQTALVTDSRAIADWLAKRGVDRQKFLDTYNSFGVTASLKRSIDLTRAYDIEGTPAIVVDGKYTTAPSMDGYVSGNRLDYEKFFKGLDQIIAMARKERGGAKR